MVDGVDEDAHILHHGDAVAAGRLVQQLFNVKIRRPGVHFALGNGDKGFAAAVLGQAQHGPRVPLRQAVVQHELPLVGCQLQQTQLVGQGGLGHAQTFCRFRLGAVPQHDDVPQALRLLKGVQVLPL